MPTPFDDLHRAIGRVVYEWAWLENDVACLVFDLCALHSPAFYRDPGAARVATAMNADLDLRANIAVAKTLAHQVSDRPGFFERIETALNIVNNELRNERNRYVHDIWHLIGDQPFRYKAGAAIRRQKGSGDSVLEFGTRKTFSSVTEADAFADAIHSKRVDLINLSEEAQGLYRARYPDEV